MAKCAYRGNKIKEIEEKWIDENVEDEKEKERRKRSLDDILKKLGDKADCKLETVAGSDFCMFHDPNYWKNNEDEVRGEFLKLLQNGGDKYFVGFHLPSIEFPEVVEGDLHMELTKFHGYLNASTTFQGGAIFAGTTFQKLAWFQGTTFQRKAIFAGTTFQGGAAFEGATFQEAMFAEATFQRKAIFIEATFQELALFIEATFQGPTAFRSLKFKERGLVMFSSVKFENYHLVSFGETDIDRFLFLSTDIEKISLRNAKLPRGLLKAHEFLKNPELKHVEFTFDDVIETYGRLRGNLEKNHRFSEAGVLFVGEMDARREREYYEMLRKYEEEKTASGQQQEGRKRRDVVYHLKKAWLWLKTRIFSPLALYKLFSNYGESIWRPAIWGISTILVMTLLFTLAKSGDLQSLNFKNILENLPLSVSLFFQLAPIDLKAPASIILLSALERIFGLLFLTLEVLALKRKLERHP